MFHTSMYLRPWAHNGDILHILDQLTVCRVCTFCNDRMDGRRDPPCAPWPLH